MNWIGTRTLFQKEVRRFLRVPLQTVASPLVSTGLYFVVFGYTLGSRVGDIHGSTYLEFIVPGLIFLGIANNAFLNTSSSFFITKLQGTVVDLLAAPLGPMELLIGFVGGGMVRGLAVGLMTWLMAVLLTGTGVASLSLTVALLLLSSYVFSILGVLAGVWAEKFEQINFFPTFIMLPLTFLGGVFYAVEGLPQPWRTVSLFNPIVYMIEALREAMLGHSNLGAWPGLLWMGGLSAAATLVAHELLRRGYKLKT